MSELTVAASTHRVPELLRGLLVHGMVLLLFILLSWLSSIFQATELRTSPWTPSTGLAFVAGLLLGRPSILTVTLCMLVSTRLWGWSLPGWWEFGAAALHALIFSGAAVLLKSWLMAGAANCVQLVMRLVIISLGVTLTYAVARIMVLSLSVGVEPSYLLSYTTTLSIGNLIAMMTIVPLALTRGGFSDWRPYVSSWTGAQWLFFSTLVLFSLIVFGIRKTDEFKFFYLIFLPVIAFSVRDGLKGATLAVLLSDALMLLILYVRIYEASTATELQFLMLSLSVTGLFLGAAMSDRDRVVEQLAESHLSLQESQSALLQASRLTLASEISAALAHELNQPLSSIRNYVRAVKRRLESGSADAKAIQTDIDSAVVQVDAAAALLRSTRSFLERGEAHQRRLRLADVVSSSLALMEPELHKSGIVLRSAGPFPLCRVVCNEVQIQQVILNLLRNAKESIVANCKSPAKITVSVSLINRPGFAEISVSDTGGGVAPETLQSLFQPLQSAKPHGLGLGLSLCKSIVRAHGGGLWLDQSSSSGATFVFTLPIVVHEGRRT